MTPNVRGLTFITFLYKTYQLIPQISLPIQSLIILVQTNTLQKSIHGSPIFQEGDFESSQSP